MSVFDSIDVLATTTLTVRRSKGAYDSDGVYQLGTPSTFTCTANVQTAYNINRVVGGEDLHALVDNQKVTSVYQVYTRTELRTRTANNDPDLIIGFRGADWTVARVEILDEPDTGEIAYHAIITQQLHGAA